MRMPGYCTECHRVKQVRVNMSRLGPGQVTQGVCNRCETLGNLTPLERDLFARLERAHTLVLTAPERRTALTLERAGLARILPGRDGSTLVLT
jgi:hypothetical protein